uniref:DUF4939 domain-containing protein n=1 Tax=Oryzias latipes TaxID=8090 RepID=A0A3B3HMM2_ORYLA
MCSRLLDELLQCFHMLHSLSENQQAITQQLTQLQTLLSSQVQEARIPNPDPFSGTSDHCRGFLLQCTMVFSQQSSMYSSDEAKIAYMTGLLRGRALEWAEAFLANQSSAVLSFQDFMSQFKLIFETPEKHHDL